MAKWLRNPVHVTVHLLSFPYIHSLTAKDKQNGQQNWSQEKKLPRDTSSSRVSFLTGFEPERNYPVGSERGFAYL